MAQASSLDFFPMDNHQRGRSDAFSESSSSNHRTSILSSVKFPSLRKLDTSEGAVFHGKSPLLILKLTSSSFLHAIVEDETRHSLYTIRTHDNTTTVMRSDPWEGMTKTSDIRWPENPIALKGKGKSGGVQVQMRGNRWVDGEVFLRTGSSSSSPRKFTIPNYSQSLKWRMVGCSYWCTTPSVKGPVAILDTAVASVPAQLQIFETLHDKYDVRPMLDHRGVSILLLDYILVTSLLLVTEPQEWMFTRKHEEHDICSLAESTTMSEASGSNFPSSVAVTSTSQWRKIMYGEPIYPKRQAQSVSSSGPSSPISDTVPQTPTSPDSLAKVMHGVPIHPKLASILPNLDGFPESDQISERFVSSTEHSRSTSPTADSIFFTAASAEAPSHTYLDPSFYREDNAKRQALLNPIQSHTAPTSPASGQAHDTHPASALAQALRPRSTPPQAHVQELSIPPPLPGPSSARAARSPSLPPSQPQRRPSTARPLPRPPNAGARGLRHTQSQQGLRSEKRSSYGQRALPSPPPLPPLSPLNIHRLGPVVDAGPIMQSPQRQTFFHSPITSAPHDLRVPTNAPYPENLFHDIHPHQQKTPDQNDLACWMGVLGDTRRLPDDDMISTAPYDVPPPAYSSINFNE